MGELLTFIFMLRYMLYFLSFLGISILYYTQFGKYFFHNLLTKILFLKCIDNFNGIFHNIVALFGQHRQTEHFIPRYE